MVSYNYIRILINFHLLYRLLGVHKLDSPLIISIYFLIFSLAVSINLGSGLIPSQLTIFISSMTWYRGSIITDAEGRPRVDYPIAFDRLLSKIH